MSLRDRILAKDDIGKKSVEIPEWGETVEIRTMSAAGRAAMMENVTKDGGKVDMQAFYPALIIAGVYDPETGEPLFTEEDADFIKSKSAKVIEMLAREVMDASGMADKAVDAEGKDS